MKYAVQHKNYGQLVCECDTLADALKVVDHNSSYLEAIEIDNSSHLIVNYIELGGPYGYGHQEVSFETYGGLIRVIINFYKWVQHTTRVFGPDYRDVKDFFRHCSLYVNGVDKTDWLIKQVHKLNKDKIFI